MSNLDDFTRRAAENYLQSIVFVDDEIYVAETGQPAEITADIPVQPSFFKTQTAESPPTLTPETKPPYHPKQLVQSFARKGMVCTLYEPELGFKSGKGSEIFTLCERADVVILDWDLFNEDGRNIVPLISALVDQSQNTVPHHARLCAIYTSRPNLQHVAQVIYENLNADGRKIDEIKEGSKLVAGATRIIVLGKPNVSGRPSESELLVVPEENLADRIIEEFANMSKGILPSYALNGMASVRRNSKRILDKFNSEMDGAFLLHRASLIETEDAFEQLPELLAEELLAVIIDDQTPHTESASIATDVANTLRLENLNWPQVTGKDAAPKQEDLARRFIAGGAPAINAECKVKEIPFAKIHAAMGCGKTQADKRLASLFGIRTRYLATPPRLDFGTIVRVVASKESQEPEYSLCLMPVCDSIRLKHGEGFAVTFPFWRLKVIGNGANGRGVVVQTKENMFLDLVAYGRPRDMLWLSSFAPDKSGTVPAKRKENSFWFREDLPSVQWVAQLKPSHAQRVAQDIGQSFSRVGVVEAEWVRLLTKN